MAFVIKEHRPGRLRALAVLLTLIWVASLYLLYRYGWQQANTDYEAVIQREQSLIAQVDEVGRANREMQMQISVLKKSAQVDREAKAGIARGMKDLQEQLAKLREEVSFYKGIVSPAKGKTGLDIYDFNVVQAGDRLFHYKLTLIQAGKNDLLAQGGVEIMLQGVAAGQEKQLKLADIRVNQSGKASYKFKYFEELSGSFRLPAGYYPRNVIVKLSPKKWRNIAKPARTFDWAEVRRGDTHGNEQQE